MFKKLFCKKDGAPSLTKISAVAGSLAGAVLFAGICPVAAIPYVKFILSLTTGGVIVGGRDALSGDSVK